MARLEEVVAQEQDDHDALERAKQESPFAGLEMEEERRNEEAEEPARELEQTDPPDDEDGPAAPPADADGKGELFDASDYDREDLAIPKVDGQGIDKIRVKFTGSVMLDRSDPADVQLYNRLTLGREVELRCAGKVSGTGVGWTTNRDGDLDAIVGERALKVETVWILDPEALQT